VAVVPGRLLVLVTGPLPFPRVGAASLGRRGTITGRCGTIPGRRGTVTGRCGTIPGRRGTVTGRRGTITGRCGTIPGRRAGRDGRNRRAVLRAIRRGRPGALLDHGRLGRDESRRTRR
jgi:hypothetical protein